MKIFARIILCMTVLCLLLAGEAMRHQANAKSASAAQAGPLTCSIDLPTLWPPNHDLVVIGLRILRLSSDPAVQSVRIVAFSDEDDLEETGTGRFSPDARPGPGEAGTTFNFADDLDGDRNLDTVFSGLCLRRERKGNSDGRVYLVVLTAFSEKNLGGTNLGSICCTVVVPHSQSAAAIKSVNDQAKAAMARCGEFVFAANLGTPNAPKGFFVVGDGPVVGPKQTAVTR